LRFCLVLEDIEKPCEVKRFYIHKAGSHKKRAPGIDVDIRGFFDNVDHEWMRKALEARMADKQLIRIIMRMLKSGFMEQGVRKSTLVGTPQGVKTKDGRPDALRPTPANKLHVEEAKRILQVMNQKEHQSLSPNQVFHKLIDEQGIYIALVSSYYRVLRYFGQMNHRGYAKAPTNKNITIHCATGPNQVWMWDITWLPGPVKGMYYYLYMIIDLFSRKVDGW